MPTYGYECVECKHHFSKLQSMKEDPIRICPECNGLVKRLLYPVGIVFKGSGWYITDSRKAAGGDKSASLTAPAASDGAEPSKAEKPVEAPKPETTKEPVAAGK